MRLPQVAPPGRIAEVAVRRAEPADAARIAEIHVRSWQSSYQGLIAQDYLDGLDPADGRDRWAESLEQADWSRGGILVIADDVGHVAGFASSDASRDEDAADDVGEIRAIYLSPGGCGRGLGRELMSATVGHLTAVGYGQLTLWVLASNARARRFYEAAGLRPDGAAKVDDRRGLALSEIRYRRSLP
jgi:ribosomal protein S18 acetylase RimI-like enzyme